MSRKQNLQESKFLIITLTDFALDALDLGYYGQQGYRLKALKKSRYSFRLSLGESDHERKKKFNNLIEQKSHWSTQIEFALPKRLKAQDTTVFIKENSFKEGLKQCR